MLPWASPRALIWHYTKVLNGKATTEAAISRHGTRPLQAPLLRQNSYSHGQARVKPSDFLILEVGAPRQAWSGFHIYSDPRSRHEHALVPLIGQNATTGAPHSEPQGNALVLLKIVRTFWVAQRYAYIIRKRPGRYSNQDLSSAHT